MVGFAHPVEFDCDLLEYAVCSEDAFAEARDCMIPRRRAFPFEQRRGARQGFGLTPLADKGLDREFLIEPQPRLGAVHKGEQLVVTASLKEA